MPNTVAVDHVFIALADPRRRALLERLGREGPTSASALSADDDISRQAIAKHLKTLEEAGLVHRTRNGREVCFAADPHQLSATGRWLQRIAQRWEEDARAS